MELPKTPRRRVANFTADEKALLAQLVKRHPVVESKLTDGKSVIKKKTAWDSITMEFNSSAHVNKRDTVTLKRAWDNMKAFTRKARASERGSLLRTGGGPSLPPPPPSQGAIISLVEEVVPHIICEIKNTFDSDGIIEDFTVASTDDLDSNIFLKELETCDQIKSSVTPMEPVIDDNIAQDNTEIKYRASAHNSEHQYVRKTTDYVKREAVLRIKHMEAKQKIEMIF